ncbi:nitrate- and nitrite sensing domain-containing protein [Hyphobacterium marinum]|uniref:Nitrate- and nitrite sensing domain-containing protein n=1 Tax=Hyphobacterium marinum TaxID=3116574 RepID=A0ABU7LWK1_9PROT|nr:nitrate- and nitrite sensing domain-containing protein [Hyphobacterium sp. Y6023]MEE2565954.1 nitrate- and nitrite sensing domain-containing protein [Hyphobacterium sp. Y6023]
MVHKFFPVAAILGIVMVVTAPVAAFILNQGHSEERAAAAREIAMRLSMINNEIQRERAFMTAFGYAGVEDEGVHREMSATDDYRDLLLPEIARLTAPEAILGQHRDTLATIEPALDRLIDIRETARAGDQPGLETFAAYSDVADILTGATVALHGELAISRHQKVVESQLLVLIEHLARERGYGLAAMTGAIPEGDLVRARQANLAALDQIQAELEAAYDESEFGELLVPFLVDVTQVTRPRDPGQSEAEAAHNWFSDMSAHIDAVRLLYTRLLARGEAGTA